MSDKSDDNRTCPSHIVVHRPGSEDQIINLNSKLTPDDKEEVFGRGTDIPWHSASEKVVKLTLVESERSFDRYLCSDCEGELLIGGSDIPKYCYHCGRFITEVDKRSYYGPCHGCVHGDDTFDNPCSSPVPCTDHDQYRTGDVPVIIANYPYSKQYLEENGLSPCKQCFPPNFKGYRGKCTDQCNYSYGDSNSLWCWDGTTVGTYTDNFLNGKIVPDHLASLLLDTPVLTLNTVKRYEV